ncbi:MAG: hypothetical protein LBU65_16815 [Planctomycetaceae bacterium]|jgi:hypothetical protein|nr:hypothetical protein [Planctomycetaceae bacterium]
MIANDLDELPWNETDVPDVFITYDLRDIMTNNTESPSQPESLFSSSWNDTDTADIAGEYRQVSIIAIIAFIFGLLSFLISLTVWLVPLGVVGIIISLIAIFRIRNSDGLLAGSWFAQLGLCFCVITTVAMSVYMPYYQYRVRCEADLFFRSWFDTVCGENLPVALNYTSPFWNRKPDPHDTIDWWTKLPENKGLHNAMQNFVKNKLVRTLMALGDNAAISYYATERVYTAPDSDTVTIVYAVTFKPEDSQSPETFFVRMTGKRTINSADHKTVGWNLESIPNDVFVPEEFK